MVVRANPMRLHQPVDSPAAAAIAQLLEIGMYSDGPIVGFMASMHLDYLIDQHRFILGSLTDGPSAPVVIAARGDTQALAHRHYFVGFSALIYERVSFLRCS